MKIHWIVAFKSSDWKSLRNFPKEDGFHLGISGTTLGDSLSDKNWVDPKEDKTTRVSINQEMERVTWIITGGLGIEIKATR